MGGKPLRVLVTRPSGQARGLCEALQRAGHAAFHCPMLELEPLEELPAGARQRILDLDLYGQVIFISGNAVRFGMELIADYWPQLPVGITWYAVGHSTARLLADYGLNPETPRTEMSSEGLLALPGLQAVAGQRLLIVKGEGGRETLATALRQRGAAVDTLSCYRRRRPDLQPGELARRLVDCDIDTILISSGEGLSNLLALLSPEETTKFSAVPLVVPSARVATLACEAGFSQVIRAANASDEAAVAALEQNVYSSGD